MHSTFVSIRSAEKAPFADDLNTIYMTVARIGEWLGQHDIAFEVSCWNWTELRFDFHRPADQVMFVLNFSNHPQVTILEEGQDSRSKKEEDRRREQEKSRAYRESRLLRNRLRRGFRRLMGKGA